MRLPSPVVELFRREFPPDFFTDDPGECLEFGRDWTRDIAPQPSGVIMPRSTAEVARALRICHEHDVPVVPSGGRTGLAGGALASRGELVMSLARMRRMDPVDTTGATVRVQAGAVTAAVHEHTATHGLTWPVDFASKGSSQVGGNIATNAGGVKVIRYGLTRAWVLGLEVVLASGDVMDIGGALEKNNTGIDLRQLFIGSEGTLGVITEATLKLTKIAAHPTVLLLGVSHLADVLEVFRRARLAPGVLNAYEFFTDACLARVFRHRRLAAPFAAPVPYYVLIELDTEPALAPELERWLEDLLGGGQVVEATWAQHAGEAAKLWSLRESISESLSATGFPHKNDIALPIAALEAFTQELGLVFSRKYPDWEICLFGHIGDGNLHVNVMKPDGLSKEEFLDKTRDADHELFALVRKHHGSISAEHGIGLLKREFLSYSRSASEIAAMRAIKHALDPKGILNPGKVFDTRA